MNKEQIEKIALDTMEDLASETGVYLPFYAKGFACAFLSRIDAERETPEFCCEHAFKHAKELAWKGRNTNCGCDHNETCEECYPPAFRSGGKWAEPPVTPMEEKP